MKHFIKVAFLALATLCFSFSCAKSKSTETAIEYQQSLLNGSWYEDTFHERSRFRSYFYRITDDRISVIDKKNNNREIFFTYAIKNGFIEIASLGSESEKLSSGTYPISIKNENQFTIHFSSPRSFIRNSYSQELALKVANKASSLAKGAVVVSAVAGVAPSLVQGGKEIAEAGIATAVSTPVEATQKSASANNLKEMPGTTGNWNQNLNRIVFEPNSTIKVGENAEYQTNSKGLVSKVTGTYNKNTVPHARNEYQQIRSVQLKDGLPTDQGGHIIAAQNGGAGEQINYVPMAQKLNQGPFKAFENQIHNLAKEGHTVKVETSMGYDSGTKRPDWFNIEWWIDGVKQQDKFFLNDNFAY